jgi:hypothetical protein
VVLQSAARRSVVVEASDAIVYFKSLVEKEATAHDFFECTTVKLGFLGGHFQRFNASLQVLEQRNGSIDLVLGCLVGFELAYGFFLYL